MVSTGSAVAAMGWTGFLAAPLELFAVVKVFSLTDFLAQIRERVVHDPDQRLPFLIVQ